MVHPSVPHSSEVTEYLDDGKLKFSVALEATPVSSRPVYFTVVDDDTVIFSCPISPSAAIRIGDQLRSAGARAELRRGE